MESPFNKPNEPVCKLGPGGDFTFIWPAEGSEFGQAATGWLTKALDSIGQIMNTVLGAVEARPLATTNVGTSARRIPDREETIGYAVEDRKCDETADAPSATVIKSNWRIWSQPMLFADDRRVSLPGGHKPKHRIRTYQRASKKRASVVLHGQGSLFEADLARAGTAREAG